MNTKFAPAERESQIKVLEQKGKIESSEFLDSVLSGTPFMFFIINTKRQVIYSNQGLMKYLGIDEMNKIIGDRPGEIFQCRNADKEPGGCGTAENCKYCGVVNAVLQSNKEKKLIINEAIVNIKSGEKEIPVNFEVSSKPFSWKGEDFFIVTLQNIEEKKRKEQLERTFFHDIINKAGNVNMFIELLSRKQDISDSASMMQMARSSLEGMLEDINYQRKLQQAEAGSLYLEPVNIKLNMLVRDVADEYQTFAKAFDVKILFEGVDAGTFIKSDKVLVKRILGNLVKNAIEASEPGDEVKMTAQILDKDVVFSVQNPAYIPEDIKAQLFYRAFSTKGAGRGIGTYSIKLFTEEYLKGRVDVSSDREKGTEFRVTIPANCK